MNFEHSTSGGRIPRKQSAAADATAEAIFLTTNAAAQLLGLSVRTLERFRQTGDGPDYCKFGKRVMYPRAAALAWADKQLRTSTSDAGKAA